MSFERLHPALQHHVAGSLGWSKLRPLQEDAIEPLVAGRDALLLAPTAGGKTEAAILPLASRMLDERWERLSVLYVTPLRALANNLEPRLVQLLGLVGRTAAIWHGDVSDRDRKLVLREPPDLLLTTPESLEVMLTSKRVDHRSFFADLRAVVVDEAHAVAADDRGWHLKSVLARIEHLLGRRLQRIGLSATVGNPQALLGWLGDEGGAVVEARGSGRTVEIGIDFVGSIRNAAKVISTLHRGGKRLTFCNSRSEVEQLAAALRAEDVETFVSHSSVSADERRLAEEAFASRSNCVIVATSTLELGIDVGDLDRVIQIDAPASVASLLQRLGRSGRRAGAPSNMLFLATRRETLLQALALDLLREGGFVEPVVPPVDPRHIVSQQLLALCLQEGAVGRHTWPDWLRGSGLPVGEKGEPCIVRYMLERGYAFSDGGMLMLGPEAESSFGRRNFLELLSVFTTPPLVEVRHGRVSVGQVHQSSFIARDGRDPVLLLGGRSWKLVEIDWKQRIAQVVPATEDGRSRWIGSGYGMSYAICQAVKRVLCGETSNARLSQRGEMALAEAREEFSWLVPEATMLVNEGGRSRWWTFGGTLANHELSWRLGPLRGEGGTDEFSIPLREQVTSQQLEEQLETSVEGQLPIDERAVDELKFSECLPRPAAEQVVRARVRDTAAVAAVVSSPIWTRR